MVNLVWLMPLLPLAGAILMLLFGRRLPRFFGSILCTGLVGAALFIALQPGGPPRDVVYFPWIPGMADFGILYDSLSRAMAALVTGVGFVIHVYSIGYMKNDGGGNRFFGAMNLFVFFMLVLVLADNYLLLFAGWEGVGLCSYLLIGHWFHKKSATDAAIKAFLVNRIGDAAFLLGLLGMLFAAHSLRFADVKTVPPVVLLLLLAGAVGKSAQFPLHVWLPDAMEGPTPVSALIHAATMVTAGVYMIARSHSLYAAEPQVMQVIAVLGALTALLAATMALVENDIKRVLAYSTMSQIGFMFLALGTGAWWVAIFHLATHAFSKALLFLGAGCVSHALSGEQDLRKMGGLRRKLPLTHAAMLTGTLAISGIPGLSGFFSKDRILTQVFAHGSFLLWGAGLVTSLLTAFYMGRLLWLAFYGAPRTALVDRAREAPLVMWGPLAVLALASIVAGWLIDPVLGPEVLLTMLAVAAAVLGFWLASRFYQHEWRGGLATLFRNRWYIDEVYDALFVRGLTFGSARALSAFDTAVVDGAVHGAAWLTRLISRLSIWWDDWIVDGAVRLSGLTVKLASFPTRWLQTGQLQSYALIFVVGLAVWLGYMWSKP